MLELKIKLLTKKLKAMKTAKLMLLVAFLAFGTMLYTQALPEYQVVKVKLTEALQNKGLVQAMQAQLDLNEILRVESNGLYSAKVKFNRKVYVIYGTKKQWVAFFIGTTPPGEDPSIGREIPPSD